MLFPNFSAHQKFRHIGEKNFICKFCNKDQSMGVTNDEET